jgi:hypothetical protein
VARGRDLGDVLHYFISDEEQRELRERSAAQQAPPAPLRWWLPVAPERLLHCALALDLAAALARDAGAVRVLAPFAPPGLLAPGSAVTWESLRGDDASAVLQRRLAALDTAERVLVLVPPAALHAALGRSSARADALILPVDATPSGLARALGWLRALEAEQRAIPIGAALLGAADADDARRLAAQLSRAALRQLGLRVEPLGELRPDAASSRALLRGLPVLEVDSGSAAAASLRALSSRLIDWCDRQPPPASDSAPS